jgi:hypothetical protein
MVSHDHMIMGTSSLLISPLSHVTSATSLHKQMIAGMSKSGLGSTTFLPAIHLQLPHTLSPKSWFQLRPAYEKLRLQHILAPKSSMIVDLVVSDRLLQSTTSINLPFPPSFLRPSAILSLNNQVTCGPPN